MRRNIYHKPFRFFRNIAITVLLTCMFASYPYAEEGKLKTSTDLPDQRYTIKKGDTLWDISEKFMNTPWQWPTLWEMNKDVPIPNPHLIYPGQRILIRAGKGPILEPAGPEDTEKPAPIAVPPPVQPVPRLPSPTPVGSGDDKHIAGKEQGHYLFPMIERVGFIKLEPFESLGSLFHVDDDKVMISTGDRVYIRETKKNSLALAGRYYVYRTFKPFHDNDTNAIIGTQHLLCGVVRITKKAEPRIAVAEVLNSYRPININDKLMPYKVRSKAIPLRRSKEKIRAKLVGSEERTVLMGEEVTAFIDKGTINGVYPGQEFYIYYREKGQLSPDSDRKIALPPVLYGNLMVVHAEKTTATVVITDSDKPILQWSIVTNEKL